MSNVKYFDPWLIPAMNKFMGMQGFELTGTKFVKFLIQASSPAECPALHYTDDKRHVAVITSGNAGSMDGEYTTTFKMCPFKPTETGSEGESIELTYSNYPLCALFWKMSFSGQNWNGKGPYLDSYIAPQSLSWKLGIGEVYKFNL